MIFEFTIQELIVTHQVHQSMTTEIKEDHFLFSFLLGLLGLPYR